MITLQQRLNNKLREIATVIRHEYHPVTTGVLSGGSGVALFHFYYSKYLDSEREYSDGEAVLLQTIELVNTGQMYPTLCAGLAGFGWVLEHLVIEDFIDLDTDDILSHFDEYLYEIMIADIKLGNYDFLHGSIGYGYYFLKRYENAKGEKKDNFKRYIVELISLIDVISEKKNGKRAWLSVLDVETGEKGYNFGLSHGIPSVISFLAKLSSFEVFKVLVEKMLREAVAYVLSGTNEDANSISFFPSSFNKSKRIEFSRISWCYGDLGIGVSLWNAAKVLQDDILKQTVISILEKAAQRRSQNLTMVYDACVCHGAYGNAKIFHKMYKETGKTTFYDAAVFWLEEGLSMADKDAGYAGYRQYRPHRNKEAEWSSEIGLLEGVAGIGLVMIDFLADFDTNWAECLMLD